MYPEFAGNNRLLGSKNIRLYFYPHWRKPVGEFKSDIIRIGEEISIKKSLLKVNTDLKKIKVHFLVNGSYSSPMGIRARYFKKFLPRPEIEINIEYRSKNKSMSILIFLKNIYRIKTEIIYVFNTGYSGVLAGIVSKFLWNKKFIVDTGDVAYELARSSSGRNVLVLWLIWLIERIAFRMADVIIVRGSYHKILLQRIGYNRVFHIPDGVDTQFSKPMDVSNLREKLGLKDHLVIGVMGSTNWSPRLKICYGWELLEILKILKGYPVKGILIGDGSGLSRLKERAKEYRIEDNIVFTGWLDYSLIPKYINLFDIAISTQTNNVVGEVRTTGKIPEYLACGRYIIATAVGEAKKIIKENGILVPYHGLKDEDYPARVAHKIMKILSDPSCLDQGIKGVEIAREMFDYRKLCRNLFCIVYEVAFPEFKDRTNTRKETVLKIDGKSRKFP